MKIEAKLGLLLTVLGLVANRLVILPESLSGFLAGLFFSVAMVLLIVSLLPQNLYSKLPYRKWLKKK